ncbi:MAG TPA: aromatic ring-hydroxylating dioxygenase subunit alpha [Sphingobium sp.]|nr:aromatic ring-hydroxylating dioxygenase subunit alpha [Sphingobium sp.]
MARYLEAAWYFGGWADQIKAGEARGLTLAEREIAVYRSEQRQVFAIGNRCPHRFAPLHLGKVKGDLLECGYHGLQFAGSGSCAFNPHMKNGAGGSISVPSYAVEERYGAVWIWLSAEVAPDPSLIPDFSHLSSFPATAHLFVETMDVTADYELIVDNLLDPTHSEFVHVGVLGGDGLQFGIHAKVRETSHMLEADYHYDGVAAVPLMRQFLPDVEHVDSWLTCTYYAPGYVTVVGGIKPAGAPREEGVWAGAYHILMPTKLHQTRYDVMTTRGFQPDDVALTTTLRDGGAYAFNEQDKPIIEAQQAMMGENEFWDLKPALFPSDAPAVKVRRKLQGLIDAQLAVAA